MSRRGLVETACNSSAAEVEEVTTFSNSNEVVVIGLVSLEFSSSDQATTEEILLKSLEIRILLGFNSSI
jgi:hypothetical protein